MNDKKTTLQKHPSDDQKDVFATFKILHIPLQNNHTTYHPTKPNKFASALALHYLCKKLQLIR